ncbi:prolyl oligopeptidase family serine peptidase [candidate division KSB1 bacterium]
MFLFRIVVAFFIILSASVINAQDPVIKQVGDNSIKVDGKLSDWENAEWFALTNFVDWAEPAASSDLDVKAAFVFDREKLYIAVQAVDDDFGTVNRGWRYGDGFFFTLLHSEIDSSEYQIQCGFAKDQKVLIYKNGKYYLNGLPRNIKSEFRREDNNCYYEVAIPFDFLKPFNPFIHKKRALNITYVDRDKNTRQSIVLLHPGIYDSEQTKFRSGKVFEFVPFVPGSKEERSSNFTLQKNYFKAGEDMDVEYSVNLDREEKNWQITAKFICDFRVKKEEKKTIDLSRGNNAGKFPVNIGDMPTGNYEVMFIIHNNEKKAAASYRDKIFVYNEKEIGKLKINIDKFRKDERLALSLPVLEVRFDWYDEFYNENIYENITPLKRWHDEINELYAKLEKNLPAVFEGKGVNRFAHRSKIDNTLQPYSVAIRKELEKGKKYPLIVVLHGSGVDELNVIGYMSGRLGKLGFPVLAPKARGLSDWYVGDAGKDVFECIDHFCTLNPEIDRTRIYMLGFSMGGYGTWRLGLMNPGFFKGLVILSGALVPPQRTGGENIIDIIDRIKGENLLIIHGDKDNAVPIENTRKAVEKLKALNAKYTYIEIPGAAHGNYNKWDEVVDWIKDLEK